MMQINNLLEETEKRANRLATAKNIFDMLDKLRLSSNKTNSRRWVWELLQNAKDAREDSKKVKVKLSFDVNTNLLEFSHTGRSFTLNDIIFLIQRVSSKSRVADGGESPITTGKFGTGFLTTHLLSEIVQVNGILNICEKYVNFHVTLNRSGRTDETILEAIDISMEQLHRCIEKNSESTLLHDEGFNTSFTYSLKDKKGIEVAESGLKDLESSISYALVFTPEIESVFITESNILYQLSSSTPIILDNYLTVYTVIKTCNNRTEEQNIVIVRNDNISIAVPISKINLTYSFLEIDETSPKLFCDFPLVGTEDFPLPVIINSSRFNPTEPRDGIHLTDIIDEKINENKELMRQVLELYNHLLEYSAKKNWGNMFSLARIEKANIKEWLNKEWLNTNIISPMLKKLMDTPIVDISTGGRVAISNVESIHKPNVCFPSHKKTELRSRIWELCSTWFPNKLPNLDTINDWYKVRQEGFVELTLDLIASQIMKKKQLDNLQEALTSDIDAIEWLNNYYSILNEDEQLKVDIYEKYEILPNQNGVFKKKLGLKKDEIEETLKDVLKILGEDCREYLVDININAATDFSVLEQRELIKNINEKMISESQQTVDSACNTLISLFALDEQFPEKREIIFGFCSRIFPLEYTSKKLITLWSEDIWVNADKIVLSRIVERISECQYIGQFATKYAFSDDSIALNWLSEFIKFLDDNDFRYLLNERNKPILPNQNGKFVSKDQLFLEEAEIDEILKDIAADLKHDIRDELLVKEISLDLGNISNRVRTEQDLADKISSGLLKSFEDKTKSDQTWKNYKKMYLWLIENKEKRVRLFSEVWKKRHQLYNEDEIAENMDKAEKYDDILKKYGVKDFNALEKVLSSQLNLPLSTNVEKIKITDEVLIQLGIISEEQFERFLNTTFYQEHFIHISDKSSLKLEYVEKILNRSKKRILEYLAGKEEYDLSDMIELAQTIFLIKKNDELVFIIARPSDYDQVILYYDTEKDVLDYEKDWELWVEDGRDKAPTKISFGKILKITGINKIPLKRLK